MGQSDVAERESYIHGVEGRVSQIQKVEVSVGGGEDLETGGVEGRGDEDRDVEQDRGVEPVVRSGDDERFKRVSNLVVAVGLYETED